MPALSLASAEKALNLHQIKQQVDEFEKALSRPYVTRFSFYAASL